MSAKATVIMLAVVGITQCQDATPSTTPMRRPPPQYTAPVQVPHQPSVEHKKALEHLNNLEQELDSLKAKLTTPSGSSQ